ncbi:hypothetical protein OIO90_003665 [Microbotryomycetes sp. JL221]|nr:hypothetical protein OIO90_003665 [Microbotryomycetes sp. JL221]
MPFQLSTEQKQRLEDDGYLVIRSFFTPPTVNAMLERSHRLLKEFSLEGHPMTTFSTEREDQDKENEGGRTIGSDDDESSSKGRTPNDAYFLDSGDKVRFFFEVDAFTDGKLNRPKELAVNKIGHSLHTEDNVFKQATLNEDVRSLVKALNAHEDPRVVQSMVICKQPSIGGAVNVHDDSTFLYTEPISAVGLWTPLEDATEENGCLSFVPGSHKRNKITHRLERINDGRDGTAIRKIESAGDHYSNPDWTAKDVNWVSVPVNAGDLVVIHGSVIHRSEKNTSSKSRYVYTFHLIDGACTWPATNWLQPAPGKPFTKLFD